MLNILREQIEGDYFLAPIWKFLRIGYMEQWQYHKTYSGTSQGSGESPVLANIYPGKTVPIPCSPGCVCFWTGASLCVESYILEEKAVSSVTYTNKQDLMGAIMESRTPPF